MSKRRKEKLIEISFNFFNDKTTCNVTTCTCIIIHNIHTEIQDEITSTESSTESMTTTERLTTTERITTTESFTSPDQTTTQAYLGETSSVHNSSTIGIELLPNLPEDETKPSENILESTSVSDSHTDTTVLSEPTTYTSRTMTGKNVNRHKPLMKVYV